MTGLFFFLICRLWFKKIQMGVKLIMGRLVMINCVRLTWGIKIFSQILLQVCLQGVLDDIVWIFESID